MLLGKVCYPNSYRAEQEVGVKKKLPDEPMTFISSYPGLASILGQFCIFATPDLEGIQGLATWGNPAALGHNLGCNEVLEETVEVAALVTLILRPVDTFRDALVSEHSCPSVIG